MRKTIFWVGILLVVISQFNCEGSFTREVKLDYSDHETKGVIFSILSNTDVRDSAFRTRGYPLGNEKTNVHNRIYISNSVPASTGQDKFYGAHLTLKSGEEIIPLKFYNRDVLPPESEPFYSVLNQVKPGKIYRISAEFNTDEAGQFVNEWPPVYATDSMPVKVQILVEDAGLEFTKEDENPMGGYVDLKIDDEQGRRNVFEVEVSAIPEINQVTGDGPGVIYSTIQNPNDRVNAEVFGSMQNNLFKEKDFTKEGRKRIYFKLNTQQDMLNYEKPVLLLVRLTNLSDNYISFLRSTRQYYTNQDNPFAEPVEIYSNVVNGYGIFAMAASTYGEIEVK